MNVMALIEPFSLVATRLTVFMVLAPPFSYGALPMRIRIMLGVSLAALVTGMVGEGPASQGVQFLGSMIMQAVIGAAIGALVMVAMGAIQVAGRFIDSSGGMELGSTFDPASQVQGGPFGRLYPFLAVVLLFASDGYQLMILGIVRTFDAIPLAVGLNFGAVAQALTTSIGTMMLAAIQIAGPLVAVLFLADVGMGLLTRVAPALNVFALGFPLKILLSLVLSSVAIVALPAAVAWMVEAALGQIVEVT